MDKQIEHNAYKYGAYILVFIFEMLVSDSFVQTAYQ